MWAAISPRATVAPHPATAHATASRPHCAQCASSAPSGPAHPHRPGHRAPIAAMTTRAAGLAVGSPRHGPPQREHCCCLGNVAVAQQAHHRWPAATAPGGGRGVGVITHWRAEGCVRVQWGLCAYASREARGPLQAVTASRAMRWQATQQNSAGCGCSSTASGKPPHSGSYSHGTADEAAGAFMFLSAQLHSNPGV